MIVHDHFEGSAHCIECDGPCLLKGEDRALTDFLRWTLEHHARSWTHLRSFEEDALRRLVGLDKACKLWQRARESAERINALVGKP